MQVTGSGPKTPAGFATVPACLADLFDTKVTLRLVILALVLASAPVIIKLTKGRRAA